MPGRALASMREEETVGRYPDLSDHGLIGDLQTAALVSADGDVDWFCCQLDHDAKTPRLDLVRG